MSSYIPENPREILLKFTPESYTSFSKSSISMDFSASDSDAAAKTSSFSATLIVVSSIYKDETYSYLKSCPIYVVGYGRHGIQILRGRCIYGGIRDITAEINGIIGISTGYYDLAGFVSVHAPDDLPADIIGKKNSSYEDLKARIDVRTRLDGSLSGSIRSWVSTTRDLGASVKPVYKSDNSLSSEVDLHQPFDLSSIIGTHAPLDLNSIIKGQSSETYDLGGSLRPIHTQFYDLQGIITAHYPVDLSGYVGIHLPAELRSSIRVYDKSFNNLPASLRPLYNSYSNLNSLIDSHAPKDLGAIIGTHLCNNLRAQIGAGGSEIPIDLPSYLNAELYHGIKDLSTSLGIHFPANLGTSLVGVMSGTLDLHGFIRGMIFNDLGALVDIHKAIDLLSSIGIHAPINLRSIIKAWDIEVSKDLPTNIYGWQSSDLNAFMGAHNPRNLGIILRSWMREATESLNASMMGLQINDLISDISTHTPVDLGFILRSWSPGMKDLNAEIHSWFIKDLNTFVEAHSPANILASIRGWTSQYTDLFTMIRIWLVSDLPARLEIHPPAYLAASIYAGPPPSVYASIRGWVRNISIDLPTNIYGWQDYNLGALIGGHSSQNLGIILKAWCYGAIENLPAYIRGWQQFDLSVNIGIDFPRDLGVLLKGWKYGDSIDLSGYLRGWQESNISGSVLAHLPVDLKSYLNIYQYSFADLPVMVFGFDEKYLYGNIGIHLPSNIGAEIRSWHEINRNLNADVYGWEERNLGGVVYTHAPSNLQALIFPRGISGIDLNSSLFGFEERLLYADIQSHVPADLLTRINIRSRDEVYLGAIIKTWHVKDLISNIRGITYENLSAHLFSISGVDLPALIRTRPESYLQAIIYGWFGPDLGAYIKTIWDRNLTASISSVYGWRDLFIKIRGVGVEEPKDLSAFLNGVVLEDLAATIRCKYLKNLHGYIFAIAPIDLIGNLHGWDFSNFPAILNGIDYPYNLKASIFSSGSDRYLQANIYSIKGQASINLPASIYLWEPRNLSSVISAIEAPNLTAELVAIGNARDLYAEIRPKVIRMSSLLSIFTMEYNEITAIINVKCGASGHSNLNAIIRNVYIENLPSYIKGLKTYELGIDLGANIGWSDHTTFKEKLPLSIDILENVYYSKDRLPINISITDTYKPLGAAIVGIKQSLNLSSRINGVQLESYRFKNYRNSERVPLIDSYGRQIDYQDIEISFESIVNDYFYSSLGETLFKSNKDKLWTAKFASYIPTINSARTKRKLHKQMFLRGLKKFNSLDSAIKSIIECITIYPENNLGAFIKSQGGYDILKGFIKPLQHPVSDQESLQSSIVGQDEVILYSTNDEIFII